MITYFIGDYKNKTKSYTTETMNILDMDIRALVFIYTVYTLHTPYPTSATGDENVTEAPHVHKPQINYVKGVPNGGPGNSPYPSHVQNPTAISTNATLVQDLPVTDQSKAPEHWQSPKIPMKPDRSAAGAIGNPGDYESNRHMPDDHDYPSWYNPAIKAPPINFPNPWNEAFQDSAMSAFQRLDNPSGDTFDHDPDVDDDGRIDLWLLGLFPFHGPWPGGLGQLPAVKMGIKDVNAHPDYLPGYRLRLTVNDTICDPGLGTNMLFQQLYSRPTKLMVLGAGCSEVSQATAQVSHLWNLLQLSYSSASPALSEKTRYKKFFRVFPPESSFNVARFALLKAFGWKKVGTLHQGIELFSMTTSDFLDAAPKHGVQILASESFSTDPRQQVQNLKKQGVKIIIGNFYENKARAIFCEAYKQNMYGAKYVWIITGFYTRHWWRQTDPSEPEFHDCTPQQLEEAVKGYFTADALPLSLSDRPGISGRTYDHFIREYRQITNNSQETGHQEAPYGYDSAWAVADILNRSMSTMKGWNRTLHDFTYSDKEMGNLFFELMKTTYFEGVSGPVMFDPSGDRLGLTQIEQLQNNVEVMVGVFDPSSSHLDKISWKNETPIIWEDGDPPPDSITEKVVPRVISVSLFISMTVIAALGLVLTVLFLVFNIRYRRRKYIKMSSPNMNNIILAGAMLAFLSVILGGVDSNVTSAQGQLIMCKFYNWTLALGFSLAFGAMFSKTWRVHKIFTNKKIQRMVIKDYQLMGIVCILVGLDVTVLTVWEFLDPLQLAFYNKTLEQTPDPYNDNQVLIPQARHCESKHMWYFAGIIYAIKGLLLVFGAFLAFETRKVTVPALNDSKFIGISVYNIVVLCLIGVPVALVMKEQVDASYSLNSMFIFFATYMTLCLVFIPKILHRNREPHSGTLFSTTVVSSAAKGRGASSPAMYDMGETEIDKLRAENNSLATSLEQCQRRLHDVECRRHHLNGLSPGTPCTVSDGISPVTVSDVMCPFTDNDELADSDTDTPESPLNG